MAGYVSLGAQDEDLELSSTAQPEEAHLSKEQSDSNLEESQADTLPSVIPSSSSVAEEKDPDNGMSIKHHLTTLLVLTGPNALSSFISSCVFSLASVMVGHLDSDYLAASALGSMIANAFGFTVGIGLSMALETLCSQAFGAREYKLLGLQTQRAIAVLTVLCIPILILWTFTETILLAVGMNAQIAHLSQRWIYCLMPSLWPRVVYECLRRFLQAQQNPWPITDSFVFASVLYIPSTILMVRWLGFEGAAWSVSLYYWTALLGIILAAIGREKLLAGCCVEKGSEPSVTLAATWPSLSSDIFRGWGDVLRLGIPSAGSLMLEWGSFEVNAVFAGNLATASVTPTSTHAILINTSAIWYGVPLGLATAASTLIGNHLGAKRPRQAFLIAKLAYCLTFVFTLANSALFLFVIRRRWGQVFTDDALVIDFTLSMLPVMCIYAFFDHLKCVGMSVLRGCGRPEITVWGNGVSCVLVGFSLSYALGFPVGWGLQGIWLGMTGAWVVASSLYALVICTTNWEREVEQAAARNARGLASMRAEGGATDTGASQAEGEYGGLQLGELASSRSLLMEEEGLQKDKPASEKENEPATIASQLQDVADVLLAPASRHRPAASSSPSPSSSSASSSLASSSSSSLSSSGVIPGSSPPV